MEEVKKNSSQALDDDADDLEEDVRQSIARIKASPFIPRKDTIRGFVYEVETGRVREVEPDA